MTIQAVYLTNSCLIDKLFVMSTQSLFAETGLLFHGAEAVGRGRA